MLNIQNLTASIGQKKILDTFSYEFEEGKIYAVMGPNGSGKSTLAHSIMGHPSYELSDETKMEFKQEDITEMEAHERAEKGIFLSFQSPLSLSGVKVYQLLQMALSGQKDPLALRQRVQEIAKELKMSEDLLSRSLNEGASGGEKKKMEVLQAMVLDKSFVVFDEVDTGVDVDALKTISQFLKNHRKNKTFVVITHYNRILHHLKPDNVLVLANGQLKKVGDHTLAEEIEKDGYEKIIG
jgi:Fe-S cluster assembly ATP-binding protein